MMEGEGGGAFRHGCEAMKVLVEATKEVKEKDSEAHGGRGEKRTAGGGSQGQLDYHHGVTALLVTHSTELLLS